MTSSPGGPRESIDSLISLLNEQNERLREMQRQLAEMRGEGWSEDGLVKAEVTHGGALADLSIDPRAMRLTSDELAEAILDAAHEATLDIGERSEELMRPLIAELMRTDGMPEGVDAPNVDEILEMLRQARRNLEG